MSQNSRFVTKAIMGQLKNNERITAHLQRIFIYGDDMAEDRRVQDFLQFLLKQGIELGGRSLYRYIAGEQHFPVDLMNHLVDWSLDEKLIADYRISPSPSMTEKIIEKLATLEESIEKQREQARILREQLPNGKRKNNGK